MQTDLSTQIKTRITAWIKECKNDPALWNSRFSQLSRWASHITGRPLAFNLAVAVILIWAISGPIFGFSDTWQLIINTATTIVTFLMVFLIQHTQNKDTEAMQMKLDELIRSMNGAHNAVLDLEELEEHELELFKTRYLTLAQVARQNLEKGLSDTDTPDFDI
ncbi:MAG TPA: low affinity iron permease family protein [Crenotrichaceae bacterium]|nr:low affinity iron permease family protein [Crenotrichaceae bacterium]